MKFTDGYYYYRTLTDPADVVQIREATYDGSSLRLFAVNYEKDERSMGGPAIELTVTTPAPDIIRVEAVHFKGSGKKIPAFSLNTTPCELLYLEEGGTITVKSGDTSLVITKNPATFTFLYKDRKLTSVSERYGHAMISRRLMDSGSYMCGQLDVGVGEKIYGFGEQFTPFVKNGQSVDIWNGDGGTCTDMAYKNIPFCISTAGYGLFVNSPSKVSFEVCSEMVTRLQFSLPGEKLDFMIIGGDGMKDILRNYTGLTGRPSLPPSWSFGLWLTSSFTTSYDEKTVMSFVDGMAERDIPLSVFHFDCYWMKENEWCGFEWDKTVFPDVRGMIRRMHDKGVRICVWTNPYIGQKSPLFSEAAELGYLLKKPDGDIWQTDAWQAGMGIVDFTNPKASEWFAGHILRLMDDGVDCFKSDFGERIPTDVVYHDGSDPEAMHNYYTFLYNKCMFETLEKARGKGQAVLFARSATAGCQKFPVHWGGDCMSSYVSMSETLRAGLSLMLSGFGFWSHDISGFGGTATPDLYKRWAAFGLLSSHSRLHGADSYRVPWLFDEESVDVVRYFTRLKYRLMPYIFSEAVNTHETGIPLMRPMVLEFTDDRITHDLDLQYMLGPSLMVAPLFSDDGIADYYLPDGKWTNFLTAEEVTGGRRIKEKHDYMSVPLMVRPNSLIPVGAREDIPDYDYSDGLVIRAYALEGRSEVCVRDASGKELLRLSSEKAENEVSFRIDGNRNGLKILIVNIKAASVSGGAAEDTPEGTLISVTENSVKAII